MLTSRTTSSQTHVLLLHAENDLARHNGALVRILELQFRVESKGGSVLEDVCSDRLVLHLGRHRTLLVNTKSCEAVKNTRVANLTAVGNDADNHLLPRIGTPGARVFPVTQMGNVPHDTVQSAAEENSIFIVHRNNNEELRCPRGIVALLSKNTRLGELVGIGRDGSVAENVRTWAILALTEYTSAPLHP